MRFTASQLRQFGNGLRTSTMTTCTKAEIVRISRYYWRWIYWAFIFNVLYINFDIFRVKNENIGWKTEVIIFAKRVYTLDQLSIDLAEVSTITLSLPGYTLSCYTYILNAIKQERNWLYAHPTKYGHLVCMRCGGKSPGYTILVRRRLHSRKWGAAVFLPIDAIGIHGATFLFSADHIHQRMVFTGPMVFLCMPVYIYDMLICCRHVFLSPDCMFKTNN